MLVCEAASPEPSRRPCARRRDGVVDLRCAFHGWSGGRPEHVGDDNCDGRGDSYGEYEWSWWPLGPSCTFGGHVWGPEPNRPPELIRRDPSWAFTVVTGGLLVVGLAIGSGHYRFHSRQDGSGDDSG
jgi:hypothetical protein